MKILSKFLSNVKVFVMKDKLSKKHDSLKSAIERYNKYAQFVESYTKNKKLDNYIEYIKSISHTFSEDMLTHYESMFRSYDLGNVEPLLSNLYDRLLAADEYKNKVANELKALLRES